MTTIIVPNHLPKINPPNSAIGEPKPKNGKTHNIVKIKKIIDIKVPDAIVESLLVLDASQGQNGLKQAKSFAKSANLSGAIITKLDGTSRGGVSLAVSQEVICL